MQNFQQLFLDVSEKKKVEGESFKPIVKVQTKKVDSKVEVDVTGRVKNSRKESTDINAFVQKYSRLSMIEWEFMSFNKATFLKVVGF